MAKQFGIDEQPSARRPVAWYSPPVLLQAGRELFSSMDFQRNLDRRESFTGAVDVIDLSDRTATSAQPFWFDFISDTGDSGNATYAVARAALEPQLHVDNNADPLPSGELLLLGGDLAYPGASPAEYQYRFLELYEKARQAAHADTRNKTVAALPQNHDWFDSLSTFCRYFVNRDNGDFIGAKTPQAQTYFAVKLPHNWWVLGFDWALTGDIDRNQFEAFRALLGTPAATANCDKAATPTPQIEAGAQLILIYPEPYWYRELGDGAPPGYPKRYQRLEYALEQRGGRIAMRLAGDQHHYARNSMHSDPRTGRASHLLTCGSGGAFMHPTHCLDASGIKILDRARDPNAIGTQNQDGTIDQELQNRIRVGRSGKDCSAADRSSDRNTARSAFDSEQVRYPTPKKSRALAWLNIGAMFDANFSTPRPARWSRDFFCQLGDSNFGFAICLGLLYGFNAYVNSLAFSRSFIPDQFGPMAGFTFAEGLIKWPHAMVFAPTALIINLLMLAGCMRIASEGPAPALTKTLSGLLHGFAHAFCVFVLYWLGSILNAQLASWYPCWAGFWASVGTALFVTIGGIGVGGLLFGCYFAVASYCGQMPNNAFSSLAIQHYKGFLRFKLVGDSLHAYCVGHDRTDPNTRWDTPPENWAIKDRFDV